MTAIERVAFAHALGEHIDEIDARRDIVDVDENLVAPEPPREAVVYAPRKARGILPAVADEDAAHRIGVHARKKLSAE